MCFKRQLVNVSRPPAPSHILSKPSKLISQASLPIPTLSNDARNKMYLKKKKDCPSLGNMARSYQIGCIVQRAFLEMRPRIAIWGCVRPSVCQSRHAFAESSKSAVCLPESLPFSSRGPRIKVQDQSIGGSTPYSHKQAIKWMPPPRRKDVLRE